MYDYHIAVSMKTLAPFECVCACVHMLSTSARWHTLPRFGRGLKVGHFQRTGGLLCMVRLHLRDNKLLNYNIKPFIIMIFYIIMIYTYFYYSIFLKNFCSVIVLYFLEAIIIIIIWIEKNKITIFRNLVCDKYTCVLWLLVVVVVYFLIPADTPSYPLYCQLIW